MYFAAHSIRNANDNKLTVMRQTYCNCCICSDCSPSDFIGCYLLLFPGAPVPSLGSRGGPRGRRSHDREHEFPVVFMNPTEWGAPTQPVLSTKVGDGTVAPRTPRPPPFSSRLIAGLESAAVERGGAAHTWIRKLPQRNLPHHDVWSYRPATSYFQMRT